jgi:hypothetical protein
MSSVLLAEFLDVIGTKVFLFAVHTHSPDDHGTRISEENKLFLLS